MTVLACTSTLKACSASFTRTRPSLCMLVAPHLESGDCLPWFSEFSITETSPRSLDEAGRALAQVRGLWSWLASGCFCPEGQERGQAASGGAAAFTAEDQAEAECRGPRLTASVRLLQGSGEDAPGSSGGAGDRAVVPRTAEAVGGSTVHSGCPQLTRAVCLSLNQNDP